MAELQVLEGCEEFAFGSGPVGALVVHGFTGSPHGVRGLGEYLGDRGIAVVAPRLPGHGTTWQDLATRTADDWTATVDASFEHLARNTDEIFLVGLSFGGALCLDLAARNPGRIAGIVTLAAMVFTKDPRRHLAPLIARTVASLPGVGSDIADPDVKEIAYDRVPTRATYSMLRYIKRVKAAIPQIDAPILVMHGRQDHTVHPSNAQYIYDNVASTDKELVWLENSYHVITMDREKDMVFDRTYNFIKGRAKHAL